MLAIAEALTAVGHRPRHSALLHLAHRRGVRPREQPVRLVHRRLAPGAGQPPGVGRRVAVPPLRRGERAPGPAAARRGAGRARGLGARRRARRAARGLAPPRAGGSRRPAPAPSCGRCWCPAIPGISVLTWEKSFMRTDYHTPRDTPALLDFDHLERLTRFYAYLLLRADADPNAILDHDARTDDLARRPRRSSGRGRQAPRHRGEDARGRDRPARRSRRVGPRAARGRRARRARLPARAGGEGRRGARGRARPR